MCSSAISTSLITASVRSVYRNEVVKSPVMVSRFIQSSPSPLQSWRSPAPKGDHSAAAATSARVVLASRGKADALANLPAEQGATTAKDTAAQERKMAKSDGFPQRGYGQ